MINNENRYKNFKNYNVELWPIPNIKTFKYVMKKSASLVSIMFYVGLIENLLAAPAYNAC